MEMVLTSTERITVTEGARGDDNRNSSALSTENYFGVFVFVFVFVFGDDKKNLSALSI